MRFIGKNIPKIRTLVDGEVNPTRGTVAGHLQPRTTKYGIMDQLERIFRDHFEKTFRSAKIKLIQITDFESYEEYDTMRVMIVHDSTGDLDVDGTVSFVRHVLPKLEEINEPRFPVMSFVEYDDYITNCPKDLLIEC